MQIKDVEVLVGITKKNIRFYEKEGLLNPKRNAANSYRDYSSEDVEWLKEIKLLRMLGISIAEIRRIKQGDLNRTAVLSRQIRYLSSEAKSMEQKKEFCSHLLEDLDKNQEKSIDDYLVLMSQYEEKGASFMNVRKKDMKKKDIHKKKMIGVIISTLFAWIFFVGMLVLVISPEGNELPIILRGMLILMFGALSIISVVAVKQRYEEIIGGEEDEASKY